jgi:hypothetical protein
MFSRELRALRRAERAQDYNSVTKIQQEIESKLAKLQLRAQDIKQLGNAPELWEMWFSVRTKQSPLTVTECKVLYSKSSSLNRKFCFYYMPDRGDSDEATWELAKLILRSKNDSNKSIRLAAVKSLSKLQVQNMELNETILAIFKMFATEDESVMVRKAAYDSALSFAESFRKRTFGRQTTMTYDKENRMKTFAEATTIQTYTYDGDGYKRSENKNGVVTTLVWDGTDYLGEI